MSGMDYPGYVYSGLIALGGVMGYVKKKSVPSLAAGLLFGSLATYGAYSVSRNETFLPALGTTGLLTGVMGARALKSGKLMPAGLIALLSLGMLSRYSYMLYNLPAKEQ